MATACIPQVTFGFEPQGKPIVAALDQPHASSDGGAATRLRAPIAGRTLASPLLNVHQVR